MDRLGPEIGFLLEKQQVEFTYFEPEGAVSDEICDPKWMTVELNVWKSFGFWSSSMNEVQWTRYKAWDSAGVSAIFWPSGDFRGLRTKS